MSEARIFKGGEFLVADATSGEIFTPEDLSDEQKQIAETASQFVANDVLPRIEEIEQQHFEISTELMRRAGALGLLRHRPRAARLLRPAGDGHGRRELQRARGALGVSVRPGPASLRGRGR